MQIILIVTMAATIWIMPFMDYWDNVISIVSMGGRPPHPMSQLDAVHGIADMP